MPILKVFHQFLLDPNYENDLRVIGIPYFWSKDAWYSG
jgi:hypothetical protein